jgi:hypothetical protein
LTKLPTLTSSALQIIRSLIRFEIQPEGLATDLYPYLEDKGESLGVQCKRKVFKRTLTASKVWVYQLAAPPNSLSDTAFSLAKNEKAGLYSSCWQKESLRFL